ncbi:MAG: MFS transporter [Octadecabacter sp.]|nr:MFS transporter [Octadecabacter sp.]
MDIQRTNWALIGLLWTTGLLAAAQFAKLTLTLDGFQAAYQNQPAPLAVSAVSVVGILGGAVAGFFVAKIGARRSVLWAVAMSAVVSLIQGRAMPFEWFMATRIIEGFGHLLLVVALPTMMVALAKPNDKTVVMGIWGTFFGVGYAVLALVVPVIAEWGGHWAVFRAHGILLALMFPVVWVVLPKVMTAGAAMPNIVSLHRTIYTNPRYFAPGLGHGIYTSIFIALVAFLPSTLGAAWLTAVLPLANLSGTFAAGFVAKWVPASKLSIYGFVSGIILFTLLALTGSIAVALIALFMTGLTAGANFAAVPELNSAPEDQARSNGAMAQIGNIGTFSGTPIYALVAGNLWGIAGVSVVICVAGAVFAGLAYRAARMSAV